MSYIIKNEFLKYRKNKSLVVLFLLSLVPLMLNITNLLVNNPKNVSDFYFTYYNQHTFFFPLTISLIIATVFYGEFKDNMYFNWITYGVSKTQLYLGKYLFSLIISLLTTLLNYLLLLGALKIFSSKFIFYNFSVTKMTLSFFEYSFMMMLFCLFFGSILVLLTRNIVVSVSFVFVFMIVSAVFMAAPFSYFIPFSFPYRVGLGAVDQGYYYSNPNQATIIGFIIYFLTIVCLFVVVNLIMRKKRTIEN